METACSSCSKPLAASDVLYTPAALPVCEACFATAAPAVPDVRGGGLALGAVGAVIGAIPFLASNATSSSVMTNGVVTHYMYRDWLAVVCGVTAAMLGLVAVALALRARRKRAAIAIGVVAAALGGLQIARGLGVFAKPGSSVAEATGLSITRTPPQARPSAQSCADGSACFQLGVQLDGQHQDEQQLVAFERACELGDGEGCSSAAFVLKRNTGSADLDERAKLLAKGCDLLDADSCNNLGDMYQDGRGVAADPAKAFALFVKACDNDREGHHASACDAAGVRAIEGKGIAADPTLGRGYLAKACARDATKCFDFALSLDHGDGGPKDLPRARSTYDRACGAGVLGGCTNLGVMERDGQGGPKDLTGAKQAFEQACTGGDETGCKDLKRLAHDRR